MLASTSRALPPGYIALIHLALLSELPKWEIIRVKYLLGFTLGIIGNLEQGDSKAKARPRNRGK
jgi:hypothetical protein